MVPYSCSNYPLLCSVAPEAPDLVKTAAANMAPSPPMTSRADQSRSPPQSCHAAPPAASAAEVRDCSPILSPCLSLSPSPADTEVRQNFADATPLEALRQIQHSLATLPTKQDLDHWAQRIISSLKRGGGSLGSGCPY